MGEPLDSAEPFSRVANLVDCLRPLSFREEDLEKGAAWSPSPLSFEDYLRLVIRHYIAYVQATVDPFHTLSQPLESVLSPDEKSAIRHFLGRLLIQLVGPKVFPSLLES